MIKVAVTLFLFLQVDSVNPNLYVNAIIGVSTFVSFYGHLLFYKATNSALQGYGLRAKFICIIVGLVLCGLQSGILETMGALEVIPCTPPFSVLARSQCKSQHIHPPQSKLQMMFTVPSVIHSVDITVQFVQNQVSFKHKKASF